MIRAIVISWTPLAMLAALELGCAQSARDLYPFPCAANVECPGDVDDFKGLICAGGVGCALVCAAETSVGCVDLEGNLVDFGDKDVKCVVALGSGVTSPVCVVVCADNSDCDTDFQRCGGGGFCVQN